MLAHGHWVNGDWKAVRDSAGFWDIYKDTKYVTTEGTFNQAKRAVALRVGRTPKK